MMSPLVNADWLKNHLNDPDLIILDASVASPKSIDKVKFPNTYIKYSRFFDLKNVFTDPDSILPNTIPNPEAFESSCQKLGINKDSKIVCYDNLGIYTAPRAWWLLRVMGHERVAVLDGGLNEWHNQLFPIQSHLEVNFENGNFKANKLDRQHVTIHDVQINLTTGKSTLIDARSAGRFCGTAPEPREGLPSGHIHKAINLPYTEVLEGDKMKSIDELHKIFTDLELLDNKLIFTCGSGITACIIRLAAELVLTNKMGVFDGSWTEWATKNPHLIETGE